MEMLKYIRRVRSTLEPCVTIENASFRGLCCPPRQLFYRYAMPFQSSVHSTTILWVPALCQGFGGKEELVLGLEELKELGGGEL